jgi:hypothetical protein
VVRLWSVGPEDRRLTTSDKELQVAAIQQLGDELTRLANKGIPHTNNSFRVGTLDGVALRRS